jgi:hypothetical protein
MTGSICAFFLFWFQTSGPVADPSTLVSRLGAQAYAEREAAARELERLGRVSIPSLLQGRESKDLEVRTRASSLLRKIEGAMLTEPTLIKLDFRDTPLAEVVRSIGEQAGVRFVVYPESLTRSKSRVLTLRSDGAVPFWKAVDLLCEASDLRPNPTVMGMSAGQEPAFTLVAGGSGSSSIPRWDHGPFQVNLTRVHLERDVSFGSPPPRLPRPAIIPAPNGEPGAVKAETALKPTPIINVQFNLHLQILAEPRLIITQNGTVQLIEAVDDLANSLVADSAPRVRGQVLSEPYPRAVGAVTGQQLQLIVPLRRPDSPGASIRTIKGAVPVLVASRRPDPLVIPLANSDEKPVENGEISVKVLKVGKNPGGTQTTIELTIQPSGAAEPMFQVNPALNQQAVLVRDGLSRQQIEVRDRQGRALPWFRTAPDHDPSHFSLLINQFGVGHEPAELRVYTLTRASTSIPFEFHDIAMP